MVPISPRRRLVAVVDEDPAVGDSLKFALGVQGYDVCLFSRAGEAATSADIMVADCLLIDHAPPQMDGLRLLGELRRRGLTCGAIIVASDPASVGGPETILAGATVIEKTLMGEVLRELTRQAGGATFL